MRSSARPRRRRLPRSRRDRPSDEDLGPAGPALLQERRESDPPGSLPVHADLPRIRPGGGRAPGVHAGRLARDEAPCLVPSLEPGRIRPRARPQGGLMPPFITEIWNAVLVHPLINLLVLAYDVVHDFGLAVVIVTVAIRLALYPLFRAQVLSSRKMEELAPALNDIKKKYGNDRARVQQEQMKLSQERGINPAAGCLPMVVFFPVLVAMYAAFQQVGGLSGSHALTVQDLRHHVLWPFIPPPSGLSDTDTIDLTAHWLPWVGNLAHPDHLFFEFIGPLPIISAILQLIASVQALPRNPPQTDDPTQRTMQSMTYYLPLITVVFFKDLASGVFIYYITTTIFQIVQQYFVMGWGQLPRWVPALASLPTPADTAMHRREVAAIAEAEMDMKLVEAPGAQRRETEGGRRGGGRGNGWPAS